MRTLVVQAVSCGIMLALGLTGAVALAGPSPSPVIVRFHEVDFATFEDERVARAFCAHKMFLWYDRDQAAFYNEGSASFAKTKNGAFGCLVGSPPPRSHLITVVSNPFVDVRSRCRCERSSSTMTCEGAHRVDRSE